MIGNENYVHLCTIPDTSSSEVEVECQTYAWGTDTLEISGEIGVAMCCVFHGCRPMRTYGAFAEKEAESGE